MDRRHIVGGGLAASVSAMLATTATDARAAQDGDGQLVAAAIESLRATIERQFEGCALGPCREVDRIREQQRIYLRASQKYPDFIEVGLDIWESVYDWHVRHQQPLRAARLPDGRYGLTFMFTTLLLRPDQALDHVGYGFDGDRPPAPGG